jgi:hypothetical protein
MLTATPTGSTYGIHPTQETRVEEISTIDARGLVGALEPSLAYLTSITSAYRTLILECPYSPSQIILFTGLGTGRFDLDSIDVTPSTIDWQSGAAIEPLAPPAYEAFKDLGRWLGADDGEVADMVGIGRTTPYTWKRDRREPRAATAQGIYEHHATLESLHRRLGTSGLRRWLNEGIPTRRDTFLAGGIERLEMDIHTLLFHRESGQRIDLAAAPEDSLRLDIAQAEQTLRPSGRRPRRSSE